MPYLMNGTGARAVQRLAQERSLTWLLVPLGISAVVTMTAGVGTAGLAAGTGAAVLTAVLVLAGLTRRGDLALRPADQVTLVRAGLVCAVAGLCVDGVAWHPGTVVGVSVVALVLDAVDGRVARRTTPTALGARLDMEVDAFLILVLSAAVAARLGSWVLLIGLARYALLLASRVLAWLDRPSPPRRWAKVVAAVQGIVLVAVVAGVLPQPLEVGLVLTALALLTESFGHQVTWLWRHRQPGDGVVA
jgi:phosphatidylglycerophosphate synthase